MMTDIPDGLRLTPFDEDFFSNPYAVYKRLRLLDPVHKDDESFYEESWTISDYESVKTLLMDDRLSVDPGVIGLRRDPRVDNPVTLRQPDMMNLDNPDHQRLRSLVHKAFTPSSINQFSDRIKQIVEDCLNNIAGDPAGKSFDIVSSFAKPIPTIVIAEFIGVDSSHHLSFKKWTDSLLLQGYPLPTESQWTEIVSADRSLRDYVKSVITDRRKNPQDDLVSRLVAAHDEDDILSDREIVDMCYLLIGAGNFTTTDLISNSIYSMLKAGSQYDPHLVVEETLRFDPPAMGVRRFVMADIEVRGITIPRGSVVNLLTGAANHDPEQFEEPDTFLPDRNTSGHLAFGRGIHHCLGAPLARLEAKTAVQMFNERFPEARMDSSKRNKRMDFRGFVSLVVTV
jgi:cytochrome P450